MIFIEFFFSYPVFDVATMLIGIIIHIPIAVITYNILLTMRRKRMNRVASYPIFSMRTSSGVFIMGPNQAKNPILETKKKKKKGKRK